MMENSPIDHNVVKSVVDAFGITDFSKATIREIVSVSNKIEEITGIRYIRMEMGVPGIKASEIGVNAEIQALKDGIASVYPMLEGTLELKEQSSRFIKAFVGIDIPEKYCVPAVGSMQGTYASYLLSGQCNKDKNTILFIDPGFPVQRLQLTILGYKHESFDVYDYRGNKLRDKLESYLKKGDIAAISYSNPNNPSWVCLCEEELQIIGELVTKYDAIVIEDMAYFGMDFRKDLSRPFEPPYQATVARYTDNYLILISSSKVFSYAGQRLGIIAFSPALYERQYDALKERYGIGGFGNVLVNRILYSLSAGTAHSTQYALVAMFKSVCDGKFNFFEDIKVYGDKAHRLKEIFNKNNFYLVYDNDLGEPVGDGFYFTIAYPGMTGSELMEKLIYYGISTIALNTTGSMQEGLRICTSFFQLDQYEDLEERLSAFSMDYPVIEK